MRIVFMGTPDFSVPALKALVEAGHQVIAVVTQPDKPKGRGKEVQMTPVKIQAMEYGIPVYQPAKVREASFVEVLKGLEADVYVVIAFGQILPKAVLELPKYGCINIHASLLPKYRAATFSGASEYMVMSLNAPCLNRTHCPFFISIAGYNCIIFSFFPVYSVPFVDNTSVILGSVCVASSRALANALKMPSMI